MAYLSDLGATPAPRLPIDYPREQLRRLFDTLRRCAPVVVIAGRSVVIKALGFFSHATPGWSTGVHAHDACEVHIILAGLGEYLLGETARTIGPGNIIIHGPGILHCLTTLDEQLALVDIRFTMDEEFQLPVPAAWPVAPDCQWELALCLLELEETLPGWQERAAARLGIVLSRLLALSGWPERPLPTPPRVTDLVAKVDIFLRENLAHPITLDTIADQLGWGRRSLTRHFTRLTGETVMERLFRLRMHRATEYLCETDLKIARVGALVAMPDASYFCRRFHKFFQMTPEQYRRQKAQDSNQDAEP